MQQLQAEQAQQVLSMTQQQRELARVEKMRAAHDALDLQRARRPPVVGPPPPGSFQPPPSHTHGDQQQQLLQQQAQQQQAQQQQAQAKATKKKRRRAAVPVPPPPLYPATPTAFVLQSGAPPGGLIRARHNRAWR